MGRVVHSGEIAVLGMGRDSTSTPDRSVPDSNSKDAFGWALRPALVTRVPVTFGSNKIKRSD